MKEGEKIETETAIEKRELLVERDWFLQTLVNMENENTNAPYLGVTLLTHGFLVSGKLVSGRVYFKGFADDFTSGFEDSDATESIKENFSNMGNQVYDKVDSKGNHPLPTFIHLCEAKFFHPNGAPIPGNKGVWWRGRLSEISGFSLGLLSITKEDK